MIRTTLTKWLEMPASAERIVPMEGLRGYAVLLVFLVHHHTLFGGYLASSSLLYALSRFGHDIGHSGVDLFFVLSGYLIYGHLISKAPRFGHYLRKRIRRLYPVFLCVVGAYVAVSLAIPSVSKLPATPAAAVLYLAENLLFLPGIFPMEPMITVTWSLSYEFLFYLVVPVLIAVTGMRTWRRSRRVALFIALLVGLCAGSYFALNPHPRMGLFIAGMLLYEASQTSKVLEFLHPAGEWLAVTVYAAVLILLALFEFSNDRIAFHPDFANRGFVYWTAFLAVGLFGFTLYAINFKGMLGTLFSLTPLRWLGNMSYSYFLLHGLVLQGVFFVYQRVRPPEPSSPVVFFCLLALNLTLSIAASLMLFVLVERRFSIDTRRNLQHSSVSRDGSPIVPELPTAGDVSSIATAASHGTGVQPAAARFDQT